MSNINEITKKELQKIYYENSQIEASKKLGICVATMLRYIKNANIKMKGAGRKKGQTKIRLED